MATRPTKPTTIGFPWNLYLRQLFSPDTYVKFINPFNFWRRYRIDHLETCHERDIIQHLERCYHKPARTPKSSRTVKDQQTAETDDLGHLSSPQPSPQILLVARPKIKLKYRGVAYDFKEVVGMQIANAALDPQVTIDDKSASAINSNQIDVSEISNKN